MKKRYCLLLIIGYIIISNTTSTMIFANFITENYCTYVNNNQFFLSLFSETVILGIMLLIDRTI